MSVMKTYLVKIDQKSVKKNPDAGQQDFHIGMGSTTTLVVGFPHINLETADPRIRLMKCRYSGTGGMDSAEYLVADIDDKLDASLKMLAHAGDIRFNTEFQHQHVRTIAPAPEYLFRYLPTVVQCYGCRKRFPHTELQETDEEINCCPKCGRPYCVALRFETLKEPI